MCPQRAVVLGGVEERGEHGLLAVDEVGPVVDALREVEPRRVRAHVFGEARPRLERAVAMRTKGLVDERPERHVEEGQLHLEVGDALYAVGHLVERAAEAAASVMVHEPLARSEQQLQLEHIPHGERGVVPRVEVAAPGSWEEFRVGAHRLFEKAGHRRVQVVRVGQAAREFVIHV